MYFPSSFFPSPNYHLVTFPIFSLYPYILIFLFTLPPMLFYTSLSPSLHVLLRYKSSHLPGSWLPAYLLISITCPSDYSLLTTYLGVSLPSLSLSLSVHSLGSIRHSLLSLLLLDLFHEHNKPRIYFLLPRPLYMFGWGSVAALSVFFDHNV